MRKFKFGNQKLYVIPGTSHHFHTEHDARFYCDEHGVDFDTVEKYDSKKEYGRWLQLLEEERRGNISGLRRQVEYVLTPTQYERRKVKERKVKEYIVSPAGSADERRFERKGDAQQWCRHRGIPYREIRCEERLEDVYKDVVAEKASVYTADFVYRDSEGNEVVEDVKSEATRKEADYVLRRKWMRWLHHIAIKET